MTTKKLSTDELIHQLKNLQLLSMDADGTLTNGEIYIDNNGNQSRKFYAHDGLGIRLLKEIGIHIVLLTTSQEKVFSFRAEIMDCDDYISGSFQKGHDLERLCQKLNIPLANAMHVGDDINDISAFLKVGFPIAVSNAVDEVKQVCKYVTTKEGGKGAIREICNLIMLAKTGSTYGLPFINHELDSKLSNITRTNFQ